MNPRVLTPPRILEPIRGKHLNLDTGGASSGRVPDGPMSVPLAYDFLDRGVADVGGGLVDTV